MGTGSQVLQTMIFEAEAPLGSAATKPQSAKSLSARYDRPVHFIIVNYDELLLPVNATKGHATKGQSAGGRTIYFAGSCEISLASRWNSGISRKVFSSGSLLASWKEYPLRRACPRLDRASARWPAIAWTVASSYIKELSFGSMVRARVMNSKARLASPFLA